MDTARAEAGLPADVRRLAASAGEIVLCLHEELPAWAFTLRAVAGAQAQCLALCPAGFPADGTLRLLERGFHLYEASPPPDVCAFFDRRAGFRLPGWEPIPDPYGAACRVMWTRVAALVRLEGKIVAIEGEAANEIRILRLAEKPHLRLTVSGASDLPTIGQAVTVLGRMDFLLEAGVPLVECLYYAPVATGFRMARNGDFRAG